MAHRAWAALALCLCSPARADFDPDSYPRYETCALCHGLFGVSHTDKFPHLGGQDPQYLEAQLRAFLAGTRSNDAGQMAAIVTELQPGDIDLVVEWFSTQDPPAPAQMPDGNDGAQMLTDLGCVSCHIDDRPDGVPYLTAQHAGYLAKQMTDFRDGRRMSHDQAPVHGDLLQITDDEIAEISAYLAGQER